MPASSKESAKESAKESDWILVQESKLQEGWMGFE